jgi:hypothetical protein
MRGRAIIYQSQSSFPGWRSLTFMAFATVESVPISRQILDALNAKINREYLSTVKRLHSTV